MDEVAKADFLPAKNAEGFTEQFLLEVAEILLSYIKRTCDREKVLDFHYPHQLLEGLEGFSLELSDQTEPLEQMLADYGDTLKYRVKTGHPRYFVHLSSGLDIIGLAGEWLTATANTNMYILALSFVLQVTENSLQAFHQAHSHYSLKKAAAVLGIGTDNVIAVKCDKNFDDDVKLWLVKFVDDMNLVAWYLSTLCGVPCVWEFYVQEKSACSRERCKFIDLLQCCNQMFTGYLFQPDKQYDTAFVTGDKTIQCGRHIDVFKLWLMWKAKSFPSSMQISPKIKAQMIEEGMRMFSYQPRVDKANFFRMFFSNPATRKPDADFLLEKIETLGKDL
ncbi:LOW QUALITY PROTEIN: glutamate decarboxylase 1-like [Sarcoramphus papa]